MPRPEDCEAAFLVAVFCCRKLEKGGKLAELWDSKGFPASSHTPQKDSKSKQCRSCALEYSEERGRFPSKVVAVPNSGSNVGTITNASSVEPARVCKILSWSQRGLARKVLEVGSRQGLRGVGTKP